MKNAIVNITRFITLDAKQMAALGMAAHDDDTGEIEIVGEVVNAAYFGERPLYELEIEKVTIVGGKEISLTYKQFREIQAEVLADYESSIGKYDTIAKCLCRNEDTGSWEDFPSVISNVNTLNLWEE
jgi:hypothetical protein